MSAYHSVQGEGRGGERERARGGEREHKAKEQRDRKEKRRRREGVQREDLSHKVEQQKQGKEMDKEKESRERALLLLLITLFRQYVTIFPCVTTRLDIPPVLVKLLTAFFMRAVRLSKCSEERRRSVTAVSSYTTIVCSIKIV